MTNRKKSTVTKRMPKAGASKAAKAARKQAVPLEKFDVDWLPVPCERLSPKRAQQWLGRELREFQEVITWSLTEATPEELAAFQSFHLRLDDMMHACDRAIRGGRPVRLLVDICGPHWTDIETIGHILSAHLRYAENADLSPAPGAEGARWLTEALVRMSRSGEAEADQRCTEAEDKRASREELMELHLTLDKEADDAKRQAAIDWDSVDAVWALARVGDAHLQHVERCKRHESAIVAQKGWPHDPDAPKPGRKPKGWDAYCGKGVIHG